MKNILTILLSTFLTLSLSAQEKFIQAVKTPEMQGVDSTLSGRAGMLVISPHSDLVITTEQPEINLKVSLPEALNDGRYLYRTTVDVSKRNDVKFKFQRKGRVFTCELKKIMKRNYQYSCIVKETENPIALEEQTGTNKVSDKNNKLLIEFTTSLEGFAIELDPDLRFTKEIKSVTGNETLKKYRVYIDYPHYKKLKDTYSVSDSMKWEQICTIVISAKNSNSLTLPAEDIMSLAKEERKAYAILSLKEKEHVSDANAKVEEGGRLFGLRKYNEAKAAYNAALLSSDMLTTDRNRVNRLVQQCDSCISLTKVVNGSFRLMKQSKDIDQKEAIKYGNQALSALKALYVMNSVDFYAKRIKDLESFVNEIPLQMDFTVVKWISDASGVHEGGAMPNVEVWGFYGDTSLAPANYETDKNFLKLTQQNATLYRKLGVSNAQGNVQVELNRQQLPSNIIFRPVGYAKGQKNTMCDMKKIMKESKEEYNMRHFRIQLLVANK